MTEQRSRMMAPRTVAEAGFGKLTTVEGGYSSSTILPAYRLEGNHQLVVQKAAEALAPGVEATEIVHINKKTFPQLGDRWVAALQYSVMEMEKTGKVEKIQKKVVTRKKTWWGERKKTEVLSQSPTVIIKIQGQSEEDYLVFCRRNEATEEQYTEARDWVIDRSNEILNIFGIEQKIPQFRKQE